jgi:hypothetical protein
MWDASAYAGKGEDRWRGAGVLAVGCRRNTQRLVSPERTLRQKSRRVEVEPVPFNIRLAVLSVRIA